MISLSCKTRVYLDEEKFTYNEIEIPLDISSIEEVEKELGTEYETYNWNNYGIEHIYKRKGISFTYKQEDSIRKMIHWINVETTKNIINIADRVEINKRTTVADVLEQFESDSWDYDSTYNGLIIENSYFDIIVKLKKKDIQILRKEPLLEEPEALYQLFKEHRIKGIEIY